mmetsp:Transcript_4704/g.11988  ORF Transcript_4704/g.11988 Transcript_4704/m.11988 type:complete len:351 (-) Transcript_4704:179-1231(-)
MEHHIDSIESAEILATTENDAMTTNSSPKPMSKSKRSARRMFNRNGTSTENRYHSWIRSFKYMEVVKITIYIAFVFLSTCVCPTYGFFDALDNGTGTDRPVCNICRDVISLSDLTLGNPGGTFAFLNNQVITCQEAQYEGLQFGDRVGYTVDQCAVAQALAAADDNRCGCPSDGSGTTPTPAPVNTGGTTSPATAPTTPPDDDSTVFCVLCLSGNEASKNGFIAGLQCKEVEIAGKNKELTQSECVGAQLLADTISDPCGCRTATSPPVGGPIPTPTAPIPAPAVPPTPTIIPPFGPGPGPTVPTTTSSPVVPSPLPQPTFFPPVTTLSPTIMPSSTPTAEPSESLEPTM